MKRFAEGDDLFETIIDALPSPLFVVDDDVLILGYNLAAAPLFDSEPDRIFRIKGGDALHCLHSTSTPEGCGGSEACKKCVVRNSVNKSYSGNKVVREKSEMQLVRGEKVEQIQMLVTTAPLKYKDKLYVLVILEDITELLELRSILPICAHCKKIRDDQEYWRSVESYLYKHLDIKFSHGICPECMKEHYPDVSED
jgi:PAS domain-containing protein